MHAGSVIWDMSRNWYTLPTYSCLISGLYRRPVVVVGDAQRLEMELSGRNKKRSGQMTVGRRSAPLQLPV
jgi:hypothetical protein